MLLFVSIFVVCLLVFYAGYFFGKRDGIQLGMAQFISVIKVFSPDIQSELLEMFDSIKTLSSEDRENKFIDYLEKHGGIK